MVFMNGKFLVQFQGYSYRFVVRRGGLKGESDQLDLGKKKDLVVGILFDLSVE